MNSSLQSSADQSVGSKEKLLGFKVSNSMKSETKNVLKNVKKRSYLSLILAGISQRLKYWVECCDSALVL